MPNWCFNQIRFHGNENEISKIVQKVNEAGSILESLCPIGEWDYNKANATWGTKWSDQETYMQQDGNSAYANIETAWGPPIDGIVKASANNPMIVMTGWYHESGMAFAGYFVALNGELLADEAGDYPEVEQKDGEDEEEYFERWSEKENEFLTEISDELDKFVENVQITIPKARIL